MAMKWIALKDSADYQGIDAGSTISSRIAAKRTETPLGESLVGFSLWIEFRKYLFILMDSLHIIAGIGIQTNIWWYLGKNLAVFIKHT